MHSRVYRLPELRFEDQRLTSFSGTVILHALFKKMNIPGKLQRCFAHSQKGSVAGFHSVALLMILHLMLGYRRLRDIDRYREDPLVRRALGLRRLPHVCTVSRMLCRADARSITNLQQFNRDLVLQRLEYQGLPRVTLDFDGSVITSGRYAEGTAIGYNDKKKGARSYYPLFCTVAQTGQVLDAYHRAGNVHDSNGSLAFIGACVAAVRAQLPGVIVESRKDSAFFSDETVSFLDSQKVEFSISVPFERFSELKEIIESRGTWQRLDSEWSYFELPWSPNCWSKRYRFLFLRQKVKKQRKEPVQLELFVPHEEGYEFKVIVTNKQGERDPIVPQRKRVAGKRVLRIEGPVSDGLCPRAPPCRQSVVFPLGSDRAQSLSRASYEKLRKGPSHDSKTVASMELPGSNDNSSKTYPQSRSAN
jgi:hypothetical protein